MCDFGINSRRSDKDILISLAKHELRPVLTQHLSYRIKFSPTWSCAQLQVGKNYSYLFNVTPETRKSWCLNAHFIPTDSDVVGQ